MQFQLPKLDYAPGDFGSFLSGWVWLVEEMKDKGKGKLSVITRKTRFTKA